MKVAHKGIVLKIYKEPQGLWCVVTKRTETAAKGKTVYKGMNQKPKIKIGQILEVGEEI